MSAFERTVSRIDLLGLPIILNLSKANKVKSGFGGCWTLAFLAFVLWALWTNGAELWQKKKPTVNEGVVYDRKARPLSFDAGTLPMMIHIEYYSTGPTDPANDVVCNFQYLLQMNAKDNGINGTWTDMEPCTRDHFAAFVKDGGIIDDETEETISYSYCLPMTKSYGLVYGFSISVTCPSQTGIDEFIDDDPTIEIFYPKYGMSLQNYTYPLQPYLYNYETSMKGLTTTRSYWDINYLNITTDHGWLAADEQTENFVQVSPALNPEVTLQGDTQNVFVFRISQEEFFYTRIYTKVQNVLAAVGGLAGSVLAVLLIVVTPFAKVKLTEAFVNEMFESKNSKENSKGLSNNCDNAKATERNNLQAHEMSPLTGGNQQKDVEAQQDNINPNQIKIEEKSGKPKGKPQKTQKQKVIDISFCEYLSSFIYKSKSTKAKMKIINDGLEMLDSRLDVFNLMKKMRDIDKVKGLFLTQEQSYLFERLSRPDVTDRANHWYQEDYSSYSEVFKSGNQVEEEEVQTRIKENQRIIQDKSQKNEVDQRILELL